MARYAQLSDCTDPVVVVDEGDLDRADQYVEAALRSRGVDPDAVVVPNVLLRNVAVYRALQTAAVRGSTGGDSPLAQKAKDYRQLLADTEKQINRASLQLDAEQAGGGITSIGLERG